MVGQAVPDKIMDCHATKVARYDEAEGIVTAKTGCNLLHQNKSQTMTPHPSLPIRGRRNHVVAFTLAEVLITLVIIGIIAAISVPVMMNNAKWSEYKSGAWKAKNTLDSAIKMYHVKNGEVPQCAYWEKIPYGANVCASYDANGNCTKYTLANGDPLPSDYLGFFNDCNKLYEFFLANLNIAKYCSENAYSNGCVPHYDGIDTIYKNNNSDKSDIEVNQATSDYWAIRTDAIKKGKAFVTTDGMIFFGSFGRPDIMVDINGQKGPNKFGHDVVGFQSKTKNQYATPNFVPLNQTKRVDKGGKTTYNLMFRKN